MTDSSQSSRAVLVLDLGGTGSRALYDAGVGTGIGRAEGQGANPNRSGVEEATNSICSLLLQLGFGTESRSVDTVCIGMAGISSIHSKSVVDNALERSKIITQDLRFISDCELAHIAAFGVGKVRGILIIAGTGSIAMGRDSNGDIVREGGLGHQNGDEGSGNWIGHKIKLLFLSDRQKDKDKNNNKGAMKNVLLDVLGLQSDANVSDEEIMQVSLGLGVI